MCVRGDSRETGTEEAQVNNNVTVTQTASGVSFSIRLHLVLSAHKLLDRNNVKHYKHVDLRRSVWTSLKTPLIDTHSQLPKNWEKSRKTNNCLLVSVNPVRDLQTEFRQNPEE